MGRPKGAGKILDKKEQDGRHIAIVEAIKAKRQACLEALEQPLPLSTLSILTDLAGLNSPLRPSMPLAQASKLAAYCAITLHLNQQHYRVPEGKLMAIVLGLISKATQWAWQGLNDYKSGLCGNLWMALAFLVERADYRQTLRDYVAPLKLSDPKEDEIEEAPKQHQNKLGRESAAQGSNKGFVRALEAAIKRIDRSHPLDPGATLQCQYFTFLHRLFTYQVIDHLYMPISDKDKQEQKQRAVTLLQVHMFAASQRTMTLHKPDLDSENIKIDNEIQSELGKFRLLLDDHARDVLLFTDEPAEEGVPQSGPLPTRVNGSSSQFFERSQEEVAPNKERLPAAKEKDANEKAKMVLDYWCTLAEPPASVPRLIELLEVPLPLLQTHLEQMQKEGLDKGREGLAQSATLQSVVLEDCLSNGKAYVHLSCDGQTTVSSPSSAFPATLAQVVEGKDILWEGELPSSLSIRHRNELDQALRCQVPDKAQGTGKKGSPRLMNALFSASCLKAADADLDHLEPLARSPGRRGSSFRDKAQEGQHMTSNQEYDSHLQCLSPTLEVHSAAAKKALEKDESILVQSIRYSSLGDQVALPLYDTSNMEVMAQASINEDMSKDPPPLKPVIRPLLVDVRAAISNVGFEGQTRPPHVKFEPMLDQDQMPAGDGRWTRLAHLCRGRLVLAMQFWLWRVQAWLHEHSWSHKPEGPPEAPFHLPAQEDALRGLCEALHLTDEELLQTSNYLIVNTSARNRNCKDGSCFGAYIDEAQFCRYRFTPADECPGSVSTLQGLAYTTDCLELDKLLAAGGTTDGAAAKKAQDTAATAASGVATDQAHVHEAGSECGAGCFLNRKWLGSGPSPVHFPEKGAYDRRDPATKEELIDEILDILETLRLSKLLSVDIVRGVAMTIIAVLQVERAQVAGANLLQVTWEHMSILSAKGLGLIRDSLLRCLGQHWQWTHPVREAEDHFLLPLGCFQLKPDKSAFHLVQVPVKQEVIDEAMARAQHCSCCHPGTEYAPEEIPGPPANPPKQPRSKSRSEGQPRECGAQSSGKAGAGASITGASSAPDLGQELHDAYSDAHKLSKYVVEALYGAGNKAAAMLPSVTHTPRTEGHALLQKQMQCAAACARLAKGGLEHRDRLIRSLRKALLALMSLADISDPVMEAAKVVQSGAQDSGMREAVAPLMDIFKDIQSQCTGVWAGAIDEVKHQAEIVKAQSSAVMDMWGIDQAAIAFSLTSEGRKSGDKAVKVYHNIHMWNSHADDVVHRLGPYEPRAALQTDNLPTPEQLLAILQQQGPRGIHEVRRLMQRSANDLQEAIAAGVLALTSVEHRLAALRAAVISIQRRTEQALKLYHGDVLQTSLVATLSEKLFKEAKSGMEEKRRKAEELLLSGEAESEKQRMEAAAKRTAKKERQLRQKAEAQRAAEEKAAAEAAAAEQAGPKADALQHGDAQAEAAAREAAGEGLEVPVMNGFASARTKSGLQSHSLDGEAYSEDEFEEAGDDAALGKIQEEKKPSSGMSSASDPPQEGRASSAVLSDRDANSVEQQEASAAAAQKKKRNKGERKRAAAVRASSAEQQQPQHSRSVTFAPDCLHKEQDDDSGGWQEAKPKRPNQRREQQRQQQEEPKQASDTPQKPQQSLNGHSERSSGHDRPPAAAPASPRVDPILASLSRPKPALSSRGCAQCSDRGHRVMECPQLQSLKGLDRADCCIALLDGNSARVERIRFRPRRSCHVCDGLHDLRACPWLQGMPEAMREELKSAYKTLKILEKDRILRHWLDIRRDIQRRLPAASPSEEKVGVPSYTSPSKPQQVQSSQQSASGTGRPQGPAQQQTAQQVRRSALMPAEHARHDSAMSAADRPGSQWAYPIGGGPPAGRAQPAQQQQQDLGPAHPPAASQDMRSAPQIFYMQQEQAQPNAPHETQGAEHSEAAYDTDDEAASELTPFPSPARPQPNGKSHSATADAPAADAHPDPYAGYAEEWDGDEAEETPYHHVNLVRGMEPAIGVPVEPGVRRTDTDFDSLMSMLHPRSTEPKGWSKVASDELADSAMGPTPAEAQSSAAAAAQAKQEGDDMQAAIQASLTQAKPAPAQLTRLAHQAGQPQPLQQLAAAGPGGSAPGLQNQIGEYNCFLNVVVQCLWHCQEFKRRFSGLAQENPTVVQSDDVVAGLADLFSSFDAQERQSREEQESTVRQIVAPTKLRNALHALDPQRFSTGEMSDAAEVLGAIYEQLADLPQIGALATQVFKLPVREAVHCTQCGKDTHQSSFVQLFHCVSATALRLQAQLDQAENGGLMPSLGKLLLGIDDQDQKTCDTDEGGCGQLNPIQRFLEGMPPPVFTLQLAWESHAESTEVITEVLAAVQEEVDIGEIYKALDSKEYRLRSMVCYYGKHYHAFVHTEGHWVAFDDATLHQVGGWEEVVQKCTLGRIQPSLLFYEEALSG